MRIKSPEELTCSWAPNMNVYKILPSLRGLRTWAPKRRGIIFMHCRVNTVQGGGGILLLNTRQQDSTDKIENRKSDEADERLSKKHLNS